MSDQLTMSVGPAHATAIGIAGDLTTLPVADLVAAVDHMIRWWGASTWVLGDLVVEMLRRARDGDQLPEHVWSNLHQASAARAGTLAAPNLASTAITAGLPPLPCTAVRRATRAGKVTSVAT